MMHRLAYALAVSLHKVDFRNDYESSAEVIEQLMVDYSDEQKADLYALLQDTVTPGCGFSALVDTVNRALHKNDMAFGNA